MTINDEEIGDSVLAEVQIVKKRKGKTSIVLIDGQRYILDPDTINKASEKRE